MMSMCEIANFGRWPARSRDWVKSIRLESRGVSTGGQEMDFQIRFCIHTFVALLNGRVTCSVRIICETFQRPFLFAEEIQRHVQRHGIVAVHRCQIPAV